MDGLIIRQPWIGQILNGSKTWEIRGSNTNKRGRIALIQSRSGPKDNNSGKIIGTCDLVDVKGPLNVEQLTSPENVKKQYFTEMQRQLLVKNGSPYKKTYAYVLKNPKAFSNPIPYKHPCGAVIWVKLGEEIQKQIEKEEAKANQTLNRLV